jgi:hypothetical protein
MPPPSPFDIAGVVSAGAGTGAGTQVVDGPDKIQLRGNDKATAAVSSSSWSWLARHHHHHGGGGGGSSVSQGGNGSFAWSSGVPWDITLNKLLPHIDGVRTVLQIAIEAEVLCGVLHLYTLCWF